MKRSPFGFTNYIFISFAMLTYIFIDGLKHFGKTMIILAYPLWTYCPIVPIILFKRTVLSLICTPYILFLKIDHAIDQHFGA